MGWMGDILSQDTVLDLTLNQNRSLRAVFGTAITFLVTGAGQVQVDPDIPLYPFGTTARLKAIPDAGNYFVVWGSVVMPPQR